MVFTGLAAATELEQAMSDCLALAERRRIELACEWPARGTHPLPLLGEYVRLIRSLGYAYVWETWPQTRPTGAAQ